MTPGGVAIVVVVVAAIGVTLLVGGGSGGPSSEETFVLAPPEETASPSSRRGVKSFRSRPSRAKKDDREKPRFAPAKPAAPKPAAPAPAAPLGTGMPAALSPEAFITRYYSALNDRRFHAAWGSLGPGVRASFGGFDLWQRGFTRTVASVPTGIEVTRGPGGATVSLTLRAGDRAPCGDTVVRRYAVTWQLART